MSRLFEDYIDGFNDADVISPENNDVRDDNHLYDFIFVIEIDQSIYNNDIFELMRNKARMVERILDSTRSITSHSKVDYFIASSSRQFDNAYPLVKTVDFNVPASDYWNFNSSAYKVRMRFGVNGNFRTMTNCMEFADAVQYISKLRQTDYRQSLYYLCTHGQWKGKWKSISDCSKLKDLIKHKESNLGWLRSIMIYSDDFCGMLDLNEPDCVTMFSGFAGVDYSKAVMDTVWKKCCSMNSIKQSKNVKLPKGFKEKAIGLDLKKDIKDFHNKFSAMYIMTYLRCPYTTSDAGFISTGKSNIVLPDDMKVLDVSIRTCNQNIDWAIVMYLGFIKKNEDKWGTLTITFTDTIGYDIIIEDFKMLFGKEVMQNGGFRNALDDVIENIYKIANA